MQEADRTPVAAGGVGGSGTRLIAGMLAALGFHIGSDLNFSLDNLWFTLLFKRPEALDCPAEEFRALLTVFRKAMYGADPLSEAEIRLVRECTAARFQQDAEWLSERADSLIRKCSGVVRNDGPWGWKEPNTHVVLKRLREAEPGLRYIHVARNGLDMAYSLNQHQVQNWGPRFLGADTIAVTPRLSLRYWVAAHRRVLETGREMGGRFLLVNYDLLCADPPRELPRLLEFLGMEPTPERVAALAALVRPPESIGRFKAGPRDCFDADDVAFVESMGFDVAWPGDTGRVVGCNHV